MSDTVVTSVPDTYFTLREQWLTAAVEQFRPDFVQLGSPLPRIRVSVGWPGAGRRQRGHVIGQCWAPAATADGIQQVYISPELDDVPQVLATLVHELCHAADSCEHGHRGRFARLARGMGLAGSLTATMAGPALQARCVAVAQGLGAYPHAAIRLGAAVPGGPRIAAHPKQTTRMRKCSCPACGYIARTSARWLDSAGTPICPTDHVPMILETR